MDGPAGASFVTDVHVFDTPSHAHRPPRVQRRPAGAKPAWPIDPVDRRSIGSVVTGPGAPRTNSLNRVFESSYAHEEVSITCARSESFPDQLRWKTSSSETMPSSGRPSRLSKNGAISACHRALTSVAAMASRAASKSSVSR
jgi:hypothetical protein